MDDVPDPFADAHCLIALALAEMDAAGGPRAEAGALFVVSAHVILAGLAALAADAAPKSDQPSRVQQTARQFVQPR